MAKKNEIGTVVGDLMVDLSPEAMQVMTGKGKKQTVDVEATATNIMLNLAYYRGVMDACDAVSDKVDGLADAIVEHKEAFDALYAYAEENHEDVVAALAEQSIEAFGVGGDESGDPFEYVAGLELADVKAIAKACGVKVMKKDTVDSLVEKLSEEVEEDDLTEQLTELGYYDSEEDDEEDADDAEAEDGEEEAEEDETPAYADMSLGDLRKLCKENGIKYTPKEKAADLVAKLDEFYGADEEEEEAEESGEEDVPPYEEWSLGELRAECKERGIKYTPKQKVADLAALLDADDAEAEDGEEEAEDEEEEGTDYSELSLGDLRKECKARGIKYTPKDKADALIAKLEEDDAAGGDEEEDSDDEEEVDESELDEVLDEEFEDEVMEEEENAAGKGAGKGKKGLPKRK